jgi:hypothetical protein
VLVVIFNKFEMWCYANPTCQALTESLKLNLPLHSEFWTEFSAAYFDSQFLITNKL